MAATTHAGDVSLVDPPAATPGRPRVLLVGTALASAAVVMLFAGMLALYISARHSALAAPKGTWFPSGAIGLTGANAALFSLLLSIPMVHWASQAARANDRMNTWIALGLTTMLGAAYINATTYIWTNSHIGVKKTPGVMLYTVTGAHVALVVVAMVFLVVSAFRTLGSGNARLQREVVTATVLFWDVTVAIFGVLWFAIYVTK
ncbi:MAG: cytochrome c oxidase subunit 3 [Acidimicrobiales bacterium]